MILLAGVSCFCLIKLGAYVSDYASSRRTSAELREEYYSAMPSESALPAAEITTPELPALTLTPQPQQTIIPEETPKTQLDIRYYPDNRNAHISSRFQKIRRQNQDIIGWLTVPGLVDEAVVQRDNSYYLRRDYRGYHNVNGAVFLDEGCNLATRPYTLMLFGHNMKSGAMFGGLRKYENVSFYRNNPFITFDTAYEDGRYVVFAAGTLSLNSRDVDFVDIRKLNSRNIAWRETAISQLKRLSVMTSSIDLNAEDQILLLITCVDDNEERRVVAARRIRENETEADLLNCVRLSISK